MSKRLVLFVLCMQILLVSSIALAGDAKQCIKLSKEYRKSGDSKLSVSLQNTCTDRVLVMWCQTRPSKKNKKFCNDGTRTESPFYSYTTPLDPGEKKFNYYELPDDVSLSSYRYGACFGGWGSGYNYDTNGGYQCKENGKAKQTKNDRPLPGRTSNTSTPQACGGECKCSDCSCHGVNCSCKKCLCVKQNASSSTPQSQTVHYDFPNNNQNITLPSSKVFKPLPSKVSPSKYNPNPHMKGAKIIPNSNCSTTPCGSIPDDTLEKYLRKKQIIDGNHGGLIGK